MTDAGAASKSLGLDRRRGGLRDDGLLYGLWLQLRPSFWSPCSRNSLEPIRDRRGFLHVRLGSRRSRPFFGPIAERVGPRRGHSRRRVRASRSVCSSPARRRSPVTSYLAFGFIAAIGIGFSGYVAAGDFGSRVVSDPIGTAVGIATPASAWDWRS